MSKEMRFGEQSGSGDSGQSSESGAAMASNRRLVLKGSLAAFAALGTGTMSNLARASQSNGGLTDVDILNFALNLEYLEAEFYLRAVTGTGLSPSETTGTGRQGKVRGGSMVPFRNTAVQQFAMEIANDERAHVDFLRAALGSSAVAEPSIDFNAAFDILAKAAGLEGEGLDPFSHEDAFIKGAFIFEDVGVTAYHGAAQYIQNPTYLDAAAGILAVEAYHAAIIRSLMYERGFYGPARKISELRQTLSNTSTTVDQGILLKGIANLVPADKNAIAFERTPAEVLNIVYEGGKSADFGFFPNKLNGAIR